jgi:serine/threonine protein kinase
LLDNFKDKDEELNLVLEFAGGRTLYGFYFKHDTLPPPVAIQIMRELAQGLIQIHGKGVTHGDIKLRNLLLMGDPLIWNSETPLVKYADFGISWSGDAEFEKDVLEIFKLIEGFARRAFPEEKWWKYIVQRQDS